MPNNQIEKGYDFTTGQLVTADNLDNLAQEATLKKGAISEQPAQTDPVASTDELLIHDVSDTGATKPKKATVAQILTAGLPITTTSITATSITSSSNLPLTTTDGPVVTATGYGYISGNIVTVASPAHGLSVEDYIELTCSNSNFSGRYRVESVPSVDSFTYKVFGTVAASTGTCSWKKVGTITTNGNVGIDDDVYVEKNAVIGGNLKVLGNKSILLPKGDTASRPTNPEAGEIRYNSTLNRAEVYDGTLWKELGSSPFEASGGNIILGPEATISSATFSSANGKDITVTVTNGHTCSVGQIVHIETAVSGYTGTYTVLTVSGINFTVLKGGTAGSIVSTQTCTVKKAGNHKVHIFTTSGNFSCTSESSGEVDVFIVGGGGGGDTGSTNPVRGGGGGIVYKRAIPITSGQSITVTVGAGGNLKTDGNNSSFGNIVAYGGKAGIGSQGGGYGAMGLNSEYPTITYTTSYMGVTSTKLAGEFLTDIKNIVEIYGISGGNRSDAPVNNTGNGGSLNNTGTPVGSSGIVIVRYPYKLST